VLDLARPERFVDDDRDRAHRGNREKRCDRVGAAVEQDTDAIARLSARRFEGTGEAAARSRNVR